MTWTFGDRTARFGLRGRRRPTPFGLPDAQGIVLAGRQWAENPAAALLDHCAPREAAKLFEEPGGMNPSSSRALVRRAVSGRKGSGRPWTREAETGKAARRLARRGSPRRGRRSRPGVLRDGQFPGRGRQKTPGFGPEAGKATAQLADRSCPQGAASSWLPSPTPRLTTGRFSKSSGPTNGRSIFFHAHLGEVSDRRDRLVRKVPCRPARRRRRQGRAISATRRRRNRRFSSANSGFPQAQTPPTRDSRPTAAASSANKVLVNQRMKRARWSMRSKCPRHRWSDRPEWRLEPRTKRRMPPDGEIRK